MEVIFLRNLDDLQTPLLLVWTLWLSMSVTAIHRAAGPQLRAACYEVSEVRPGVRCPLGEARITPWVYSVFFFFSCIIKWRLINEDVFLQTNGTGVLTCLHHAWFTPLDLSTTQLSTLKNPSPILTGNLSFSCSTLTGFCLLDICLSSSLCLLATGIVWQWLRKTTSSTLHFLPYLVGFTGKFFFLSQILRERVLLFL